MPKGIYKRKPISKKTKELMRKSAKERYKKRKIKPHEYTKLHPDLVKEIKEQYKAGCYRTEIARLLGINILTVRKYTKDIKIKKEYYYRNKTKRNATEPSGA